MRQFYEEKAASKGVVAHFDKVLKVKQADEDRQKLDKDIDHTVQVQKLKMIVTDAKSENLTVR